MTSLIPRSLFEDTFDDFFRGFLARPFALEPRAMAPVCMDVIENENAYRVYAELPGVRKEDINVTIQSDTVTISGETRREHEARDDETVLCSERWHGRFSRTFSFDQEIDETSAEAHYNDGVLELVLPKKSVSNRKRLTIN